LERGPKDGEEIGGSDLPQRQAKIFAANAEKCFRAGKIEKALNLWTTAIERWPEEDEYAIRLAEVSHNSQPTSLDLSRSKITDDEIESINEIVSKKPLRRLLLGLNQIDQEGSKLLINGLKTCPTLTELSLCRNRIGDTGAQTIAEVLDSLKNLKKIDISDNRISSRGIEYLAVALQKNSSITYLDLSFNPLGENGVYLLAKRLCQGRSYTKIQHLLLERTNFFGENTDTCASLLELAKTVESIQEIWLGKKTPSINPQFRFKLVSALRQKTARIKVMQTSKSQKKNSICEI